MAALCHVCMCDLPADSPFSDGLGNDYLFVGNMVYTVSILPVYYLLFALTPYFVFLYFLVCIVLYNQPRSGLLPQIRVSSRSGPIQPVCLLSSTCPLFSLSVLFPISPPCYQFASKSSHGNVSGVYLLHNDPAGLCSVSTKTALFDTQH